MSMRFASAGTGATPALPMAVIFPPEIMIVWSAFAAAPVPSITRTCSSAITGDCTRMKSFIVGCGCGWAKPLAQQTTIRAMSKRRIEASSAQEPCSIIACLHPAQGHAAVMRIKPNLLKMRFPPCSILVLALYIHIYYIVYIPRHGGNVAVTMTSIRLDTQLADEAAKILGAKSRTDAVHTALREIVALRRFRKLMKKHAG